MITRSLHAEERQREEARLDAIFRRKVKARDAYTCQKCRSHCDPQCAHFFTRKRRATRWRMDCAVTLCDSCHRYFTKRPLIWRAWLESRIGCARYDELLAESYRVKAVDLDEVRVALEAA